MRTISCCLLLWVCSSICSQAASAAILKVLPQYLDKEGRHALSPSLYERDAYQAYLRQHPEKRSGMRFAVNWKAKGHRHEELVLRMELRSGARDPSQPVVLEKTVRTHFFSSWSALPISEEQSAEYGNITAWRATLWHGTELLAEQKSFLW
jgi:hypothetical protein